MAIGNAFSAGQSTVAYDNQDITSGVGEAAEEGFNAGKKAVRDQELADQADQKFETEQKRQTQIIEIADFEHELKIKELEDTFNAQEDLINGLMNKYPGVYEGIQKQGLMQRENTVRDVSKVLKSDVSLTDKKLAMAGVTTYETELPKVEQEFSTAYSNRGDEVVGSDEWIMFNAINSKGGMKEPHFDGKTNTFMVKYSFVGPDGETHTVSKNLNSLSTKEGFGDIRERENLFDAAISTPSYVQFQDAVQNSQTRKDYVEHANKIIASGKGEDPTPDTPLTDEDLYSIMEGLDPNRDVLSLDDQLLKSKIIANQALAGARNRANRGNNGGSDYGNVTENKATWSEFNTKGDIAVLVGKGDIKDVKKVETVNAKGKKVYHWELVTKSGGDPIVLSTGGEIDDSGRKILRTHLGLDTEDTSRRGISGVIQNSGRGDLLGNFKITDEDEAEIDILLE